LRRIIVHPPKQ